MDLTCSHCRATSPPTAMFCQGCGASLGATILQGRTLLNPAVQGPATAGPTNQNAGPAMTRPVRTACAFPVQSIPPAVASQREQVIMVNDVSGSMEDRYDGRFTKLQAAIRASISMVLEKQRVDPHDEVGVVKFTSRARVVIPIYAILTHKPQIIQAIQSLTSGGGTDINQGLKVARDLFDWSRSDVVRRIVLLTDGQGGNPLATADDLKGRSVVIDVIGVGDHPGNVDEKLLKAVASTVQGELRYRFIKDQKTLVDQYTKLAGKTMITP